MTTSTDTAVSEVSKMTLVANRMVDEAIANQPAMLAAIQTGVELSHMECLKLASALRSAAVKATLDADLYAATNPEVSKIYAGEAEIYSRVCQMLYLMPRVSISSRATGN